MAPASQVLVLAEHRVTRRQVARALISGGMDVVFVDAAEALLKRELVNTGMVIIDADTTPREKVELLLAKLSEQQSRPAVVLLSVGENKNPLVELIRDYDIGNLVAKHGAIRATHPVVDERELMVTCHKVMKKEIFGIEKYVGAWGVQLHRRVVKALKDKSDVLNDLEHYLGQLDAPTAVVPDILAVADEFIVNAVVHAPRNPDGGAKYEHLGPAADISLEPGEEVDVTWACDSQRLMLSVGDNFGALNRATVLGYVAKGLGGSMQVEQKTSGAGIGLSISFLSIHQLVYNIHERVRTEAIAGWYLRVNTAVEFRQVGKSLNVFYLAEHAVPREKSVPKPHQPVKRDVRADAKPVIAPQPLPILKPVAQVANLFGRLDERTNLAPAARAQRIDLSRVTSISSRGVQVWNKFVSSLGDKPIELVGVPEPMVRMFSEVANMLGKGMVVRTVMAPYECQSCTFTTNIHMYPKDVIEQKRVVNCPSCGEAMQFAGFLENYAQLSS